MGKEWYWTGRSSKRGEGGDDAQNHSGCMCAFFQFFDFHPIHFPIQQQQPSSKLPSDNPEDQSIPEGAEAPRNSLESEDGTMSFISKEEDLKIPKRMQIKTSRRVLGGNESDLSSEISNSPCTKTPTLVARLMGLDLLPDAQSPSSTISCISTPNTQGNSRLHLYKQRRNILTKPRKSTDSDIAASRSLPETPRISFARKSDVDHRLSLQINKENLGLGEELELPRFSFSNRKFEEQSCRSPSHYARQIVRQVKESVSRKVGLDITNTVKNREQTKEELLVQIRVKKSPKTSMKVIDESSPGKNPSPLSSSPRLRFMEAKQKPTTKRPSLLNPKDQNSHPVKLPSHPPINIQPQNPRVLTKSKPQAFAEQELQNQKSVPKFKKDAANERFSARLKNPRQTSDIIKNKQEESFVRPPRPSPTRANDSKSKRTSNILNLTSIPNLRPVKTDPSTPETKIPQKQPQEPDVQRSKRSSQLSSCQSQAYKQEAKWILATREGNAEEDEKSNGASTTGACGPSEFEYVKDILNRTTEGNEGARNRVSLDPSIFHHLEQYYYPTSISTVCSVSHVAERNNQLGLRCNRKLLFDLVDEILGEIQKPWVKQDRNYHGSNVLASQLMAEAVWKRIRSFPEAHCEVLEDIDELIEREDLGKMMKEGLDGEEEELVAEIGRSILETLVHEEVAAFGAE